MVREIMFGRVNEWGSKKKLKMRFLFPRKYTVFCGDGSREGNADPWSECQCLTSDRRGR